MGECVLVEAPASRVSPVAGSCLRLISLRLVADAIVRALGSRALSWRAWLSQGAFGLCTTVHKGCCHCWIMKNGVARVQKKVKGGRKNVDGGFADVLM